MEGGGGGFRFWFVTFDGVYGATPHIHNVVTYTLLDM